ncbi:hypothetical protein [Marmoricola sp. URHB0036]|uniref:hypothetical protein n=1 Tax=Marmoricola sp. URHB0036 TaxID=1298863 RepID=UPI0003F66F49|nr:hypothetical protein [Marmoricola sp. URHB0036]
MRIVGLLGCVLMLGGVSACAIGGPPRADETDPIAQIVALAIDFPRQDDATGYARAAASTRAGQDGRLAVVQVGEKHIVVRVHLEAYDDTTSFSFVDRYEPEVFTCYDFEVGVSGVSAPERRSCPAGAAPVHLPPPPPETEIPVGADGVVRSVLRHASSEADAVAAVRRGLRPPTAGALAPEVRAAVHGADIGISVRGDDGCLLGSRVGGKALVWRPSWVQVQPGELSCDPATALGRLGIDPPH